MSAPPSSAAPSAAGPSSAPSSTPVITASTPAPASVPPPVAASKPAVQHSNVPAATAVPSTSSSTSSFAPIHNRSAATPLGSRQPSPSSTLQSATQSPQSGLPQSATAAQAAFRPLNVRDALSYLDRVKQQFMTEYEVYDQFLTIMKQFKTQAIDTPGVIDRVSTLFRGHPSLIQGFNTFLPPGYRIECVVSSSGGTGNNVSGGAGASNTITVTTPMGVTTRTQDVGKTEARAFAKDMPGSVTPGAQAKATGPAAIGGASTPVASASGTTTPATGGSTGPTRSRIISPPAPIPPFQGGKSANSATSTPWSKQQPLSYAPRSSMGVSSTGTRNQSAASQSTAAEEAAKAKVEVSDAADAMVSSAPATARREAAAAAASDGAGAQSAGASTATGTGSTAGGQPQVMEFNHAINYVNKIKNRFTKDPETYKTFLEILQTYQKETRPIQEVYTQVTALFRDAPDLLDEFKAFLPDTTDQSNAQSQQPAQRKRDVGGQQRAGSANTGGLAGSKKASGNVSAAEEKKKRAAPGMSERVKTKRAKTQHGLVADSPPIQQQPQHQQPQSTSKDRGGERGGIVADQVQQGGPAPYHIQPYGAPPPGFPGAPPVQSAYDAYVTQHRAPQLVQTDEFGFFDRVKKYLDDRTTYTEFLKLLNLYTQEIIDMTTLLEKSMLFFGQNDELVAQFKELVGWDTVKDGRIPGEDWIIDNESTFERPGVQLHLMKSYGPSYRRLPDSEIDLACSGRGPLDWSVLNDEWVAYATWASEGTSAHRKNQYEEAMYNAEQERHWYSFHIESNLRTIAYLEPLAARIAHMTPDERSAFKLPKGFEDGTAPSVYERIIRKIYGKDHGWEILMGLFESPATAVPLVLSRLKQKDEEWKRAEREWNKIWREVDNKNYYRALDHQGIPFKAIDKKATTTSKALTTEIETLRREKQRKQFDLPNDAKPLRPLHQFELGMTDREVLFDVLKLTFSYLDRDQSGISAPERQRVETFVRYFVPLFYGISHADMEAQLGAAEASEPDEDEPAESEVDTASEAEAAGAESSADTSATTPATAVNGAAAGKKGSAHSVSKKGGAADLRKRLLKHAAGVARGGQGRSRATSPVAGGEDANRTGHGPAGLLGEQTWIQLGISNESMNAALDEPLPTRRFNFFANATFYCLIRTIHTLYHRLATFKETMTQLARAHDHHRLNPLAIELGLATTVPVIDGGQNPAEHYYEHALDLAEKLFDGEMDQQTYEEQLRYMGGIKAYPLYTVDKLISTVIKHIHTINGDTRCQDLVSLLEKDRARTHTTTRQQIAYRMEAEAVIGADDPLYRLEWIADASVVTVQLLGKEDLTLDDAYGSDEKMHASWVASYALTSATEGVGAHVKAPLLKRNRTLSEAEDPQTFALTPGLEARVGEKAYQLHFVANTEDFMFRQRPLPDTTNAPAEPDAQSANGEEPVVPLAQRRSERFRAWVEEQLFPTPRDEDEDADMSDAGVA